MMHWVKRALFLLPVLILLPGLNGFPYQPGAEFSDFSISHYPNALYLQRSLLYWNSIPLWSSTILSGYPFAANPLAGLFYLPTWLAVLLPLPFGLNFVILLHLIWGGIGLYLFLKAQGIGEGAALFGALSFEALPKLFAHLGAGHVTLVYAVAWTPWLLYFESIQCADKERFVPRWLARWRWALPGLLLGATILADPRWGAYAGMIWLAFGLWQLRLVERKAILRGLLRLAGNGLFALLVAAPLLLPLMEYTRLSTRSMMQPGENLILSLPPGQFLGLFYPFLRGPAEWALYPGGIVLALFLLALLIPAIRKQVGFWIGVVVVTLLMALGSNFAPVELLARLPGFDLLRVPPRVLFLTGLALCIVAAYVFQALSQPQAAAETRKRFNPLVILFALAVFVVLFGAAVVLVIPQANLKVQFGWGALTFLIGTVVIFWTRQKTVHSGTLLVILLTLTMADLIGVNSIGLTYRSKTDTLSEGQDVASYLAQQGEKEGGLFRVYSPSYSLPQQTAAQYDLELVDGVDPLQLASYATFMERASGVPFEGYSVTLPPFANAEPSRDNQDYQPDSVQLGLLNARYVVSAYEIKESTLFLVGTIGKSWVYENPRVMPKAWMQDDSDPAGVSARRVQRVKVRPNAVEVDAEGPGLLVLSEIAYPGWVAMVDDAPVEIQPVGGVLRGVTLEAGMHTVKFDFRPMTVYAGLGLCALALLVVSGTGLVRGVRQ